MRDAENHPFDTRYRALGMVFCVWLAIWGHYTKPILTVTMLLLLYSSIPVTEDELVGSQPIGEFLVCGGSIPGPVAVIVQVEPVATSNT